MADKQEYLIKIDTDREFHDVLGVLKLERKVISVVSARGKDAIFIGAIIIILGGVANLLGSLLFGGEAFGLATHVWLAILSIITAIVYIVLIHYVAEKIMGGEACLTSFAKPMAFGFAIMWANIIYFLQFITYIWLLVITFVILKTVHKLDTRKAIWAIAISLFVSMIFAIILGFGEAA